MSEEIIKSIRNLEAERTEYKNKVDAICHILRKTCGSCGHRGIQCIKYKDVVGQITVEKWWKTPESHTCSDWRFNYTILKDIRIAVFGEESLASDSKRTKNNV